MTDLLTTVIHLTETIRQVVKPELGKLSSRAIQGIAASGDTSFSIDILAEEALLNYLEEHRLPMAYYSEDKGLVRRVDNPEFVLIVDPIDGTRPAAAGFESSCVSVALAKVRSLEDCKFEDLLIGCVQEIKSGMRFTAEKGKGAQIWEIKEQGSRGAEEQGSKLPLCSSAPLLPCQGSPIHLALSPNHDLNRLFWSFEVAGRPAQSLIGKLAPLINRSGVSGGCFILNSSAYSVTRLLTGQLDAVVDIGERVLKEDPSSREELSQVDAPGVVGLFPYDLAAAYLIALEAGCFLTDAYGKDLGPRPLFGNPENVRLSCIAASNRPLHEKLIQFVEDAFVRCQ
jgi:myo-inositol-1(or 4)-monophosphatase